MKTQAWYRLRDGSWVDPALVYFIRKINTCNGWKVQVWLMSATHNIDAESEEAALAYIDELAAIVGTCRLAQDPAPIIVETERAT